MAQLRQPALSRPGFGLPIIAALVLCCVQASAQELVAHALVEKQEVLVGEPFLFQIRVEGAESPEKPDLAGLTDFSIQELGGSQNSSQSVSIIQGQMKRVVRRGYVFNYRLTARKAGTFTIPSLTVRADGHSVQTRQIGIRATPPRETSDFKLRISLSDRKPYVGQPVVMTVKWYVGKNVREVAFTVPVLSDPRFEFSDPRASSNTDRHVQVVVGGGQVVAERGLDTINGREFLTVTFTKIMVPKQPGAFVLPRATVAGQAVKSYQRRRSLFDDMFDDPFFGDSVFGRQAVFERFVVPSNRPAMEVRALPEAGRPANFSGLIGTYGIEASATPTEVNVGDPITVKVRVSGPRYLGNVELPPLAAQSNLARDFKVPQDRAAGTLTGRAKEFTQTLRARHSDVAAIPPIELAFFNPKSGAYEVARTEPIPLTVKGTRVITARDAEGFAQSVAAGSELESSEGGIRANYEGAEILANQAYGPAVWLRNPAWMTMLALPPLVYLGLFGFTVVRRWRESDPAARRSRQAPRNLNKTLGSLRPADSDEFYSSLLEALRHYLGDRLGLASGALTFADVKPVLAARGVEEETIERLKRIFERCEAGRYAGAASGKEDPAELARSAREIAKTLEEATA